MKTGKAFTALRWMSAVFSSFSANANQWLWIKEILFYTNYSYSENGC